MAKQSLLAWLEMGNLSIPSALLLRYKFLGLSEQELVLLLQLYEFLDKGNDFPTPNQFAERMTLTASECSERLSFLIQRGYVSIIEGENSDGIRYEKYSLQPLQEKIVDQFLQQRKQQDILKRQEKETDLYTVFEQEFGRPLSPFECESLAMWLDEDQQDPAIIKIALREAVITGKLNFRYIDRILFEWKRNGIRTVEQAEDQARSFRLHQRQQTTKQKKESPPKKIPFYNWLEQ